VIPQTRDESKTKKKKTIASTQVKVHFNRFITLILVSSSFLIKTQIQIARKKSDAKSHIKVGNNNTKLEE
jgi:hypothetical protein